MSYERRHRYCRKYLEKDTCSPKLCTVQRRPSQFTVSLPRMRTCAARVPPVTIPPPIPLPLPLSGVQRREVKKRGQPPSSKQLPATAPSSTSRRGPCTSSTCSAWGQLPTPPQLPLLTQPPPTCFLNKQHVLLCSPQAQAGF